MRKLSCLLALAFACMVMRAAEWPTDGGDSMRDAWQRKENVLNKENAGRMQLVWKIKLDNEPHEMHSLFPPLIVENIKTSSGPKEIVLEAGSSDNLYAIDAATGSLLWKKHFNYQSSRPEQPGRGPLCPAGLVATPVVGPESGNGTRIVYAASGDGRLHSLNVADGEDVAPPADFLPPNAKAYALNYWKNYIYSTTAQGCGGNKNAVFGIDLATKKVTSFIPGGNGGLWGRQGAAIGSDGTLYAPTGDGEFDPGRHMYSESLIAVAPETLALKDYYSPTNAPFMWKRDLDMNVTPVVFPYKGRDLIVASSKECRFWMLDSQSLGGADHRTPLYRSPLVCNDEVNFASAGVWGSLASWLDGSGTRWVLSPFWGPPAAGYKVPTSYGPVKNGAIIAFKVEEQGGKLVLAPAWMSRDMNLAEPPVIANGVVYAFGNGEDTTQATAKEGLAANTSAERIKHSTHAVVYALDAQTGNELWSSGDTIKSFAHFSGLSIANGRVYLGTFDSVLYSFGLPNK